MKPTTIMILCKHILQRELAILIVTVRVIQRVLKMNTSTSIRKHFSYYLSFVVNATIIFCHCFSRFNGHKLVHLDLKGAPPKMEYLIKVYTIMNNIIVYYWSWGYRFLCAYTLPGCIQYHLKVSTNVPWSNAAGSPHLCKTWKKKKLEFQLALQTSSFQMAIALGKSYFALLTI